MRKADKTDIPLVKTQYSDGRHKIQVRKITPQHQDDAERFKEQLGERLRRFLINDVFDRNICDE